MASLHRSYARLSDWYRRYTGQMYLRSRQDLGHEMLPATFLLALFRDIIFQKTSDPYVLLFVCALHPLLHFSELGLM